MAERKDCHVLISRFEKMHRDKIGPVTINRHVERWTADSLLESMPKEELNLAMDYYFKISAKPTWQKFARNADSLFAAYKASEQDKAQRSVQRQKLKEIVSEYRG